MYSYQNDAAFTFGEVAEQTSQVAYLDKKKKNQMAKRKVFAGI